MLLSDLVEKTDELLLSLVNSLDKEGLEGFFNDPNTIKKHLQIEEKDIKELNEESSFYCKQKDWEQAIKSLGWLTFFEPLNPDHFLRLGSVFLLIQEYEAGIKTLGDGFLLDPKNPEFALYIGCCLQALGSNAAAKQAFTESLELSKDNPDCKLIYHAALQALHT